MKVRYAHNELTSFADKVASLPMQDARCTMQDVGCWILDKIQLRIWKFWIHNSTFS
ncbi:MAG: hypothetical protein M0Q38_01625 [Bacteroidales bacterium]|nr:hypothetical protein [Bacteroidales bacterium]